MGIKIHCVHTTGYLKIHCAIKPRFLGIFRRECNFLIKPFVICTDQEKLPGPAITPKPMTSTNKCSDWREKTANEIINDIKNAALSVREGRT